MTSQETVLPPSQRQRAVLVDTSAFYARLDRDDRWYTEALKGFQNLAQERRLLYTTNLVLAETYTLALVRLGYTLARRWLEALSSVNLVFQRPEHHPKVQALLARNPGRGFSYTDAFSFLAMEELGVQVAFSFDRHFQEYGWAIYPHPLP